MVGWGSADLRHKLYNIKYQAHSKNNLMNL
jgi:hypothetical protein